MRDLEKLAIAAVASLITHVALGAALEQLPAQHRDQPRELHITVVPPPPPPDEPPPPAEPKPPEPPKPQPKPVVHPTEPPHVSQPATHRPEPPPPSPSNAPASSVDNGEQVFDGGELGGVSSPGGQIALGAGGGPTPAGGSAAPAHAAVPKAAEPIQDYEASTPPLPQGRCAGKYTEEARVAGVEGVVLLDLVVGEDGSVRDIAITQRLGHGLDEAAVAALRACKFTPGEQAGKPVAVRIRKFKARFVLSEAP